MANKKSKLCGLAQMRLRNLKDFSDFFQKKYYHDSEEQAIN